MTFKRGEVIEKIGQFTFLTIGIVIGLFLAHVVFDYWDIPMPCAYNEVYVWTDYPDDAKCVSNQDHSQHADQRISL